MEHLASTVFCGCLTPFHPDYSLASRGLPQRQVFSRDTKLDPPFLLYRLMKQPEVSSPNPMCGIWDDTLGIIPNTTHWDDTLGEIPERVYDDLVALLKGPCSEGSFWGVRVVKAHELSLFNSRNYAWEEFEEGSFLENDVEVWGYQIIKKKKKSYPLVPGSMVIIIDVILHENFFFSSLDSLLNHARKNCKEASYK